MWFLCRMICKLQSHVRRGQLANFLKRENGIRLILAPKSHKHLGNSWTPTTQGRVKLPGSFNLVGILRVMIELQVSVNSTVWLSSHLLLLVIISLRYFAYVGISVRASAKGILSSSFLKVFKNLVNLFWSLGFFNLCGKGILVSYFCEFGTDSCFFPSLSFCYSLPSLKLSSPFWFPCLVFLPLLSWSHLHILFPCHFSMRWLLTASLDLFQYCLEGSLDFFVLLH